MKKLLLSLFIFLLIVGNAYPQARPVLDYAEDIAITDADDYYTGDEVETALQEIGAGTTLDSRYLLLSGGTMTGNITMPDAGTIGLGTGKALIQFDDETTDYISLMNANVGIGTSSPTAKLEISGQYFSTQYTCTTTLNWNNGNRQYIQLANGTQTFTFANPKGGALYSILLMQPNSGAAGTVIWPATVKWPNASAPTLSTTNAQTDKVVFEYDSVNNIYIADYSLNH